jgi:hypothetical protein
MSPAGFEPTISAGKRPQTYALDRAATGTGDLNPSPKNIRVIIWNIMRWTGYVARNEAEEVREKFSWEDTMKGVHLKDVLVYRD